MWQLVFFDQLWRWAKTVEPDVSAYFDQVRRGIPGWGPKHTGMFAVLDEEGFDVNPLLVRYILANFKMEDILKWHEKMAAQAVADPAHQQALEAIVADLAESAEGMRTQMPRWEAFAGALLAFATEKAVEVYPEIINSGPEAGTRYFKSMPVTPMGANHSQISDPSSSIASLLYPPPGNTTTAAPVFFSRGGKMVMVGFETFLTMPSLYDSVPVISSASGIDVDQMGNCWCAAESVVAPAPILCAFSLTNPGRLCLQDTVPTTISSTRKMRFTMVSIFTKITHANTG